MQIRQFAETSVLLDPPQKDINLKNHIPQVGARLIHHVENWKSITNDSWVLGIVQEGLRLQFKSFPPGSGIKETKFMNAQNELFLSRRGSKIIRKKCHRTSTKKSNGSGLLQHFFPGPEKGRRISANIKSKETEHISGRSTLQDGVSQINNQCDRHKRLGSVNRFDRCIPTCGSVPPSSQVSEVLFPRSALPISGNALWAGYSAPHLYEAHVGGGQLPQKTSNSDIHVSRRLAAKESEQTIIAPAIRRSSSYSAEVRSASQLQEISAGTSANHSVSGFNLQYQGGFDLSDRGEVSEAYVSHANDMQSAGSYCPVNFETPGHDGFLYRYYTPSQATYAPYSVLPIVVMAPSPGQFVPGIACTTTSYPTSGMVEKPTECIPRGVIRRETATQCDIVDRCLSLGLGGSHEQLPSCRNLESPTEIEPYKLVGDESHTVGSPSFSRDVGGLQDFAEVRQLDSSRIHQQTGGDEVLSAVLSSLGDLPLVCSKGNNSTSGTYSREEECPRGRPITRSDGGPNDRMEPETDNSSLSVREVCNSEHRPLCNQGQQEAASILLSLSRPTSLGSGRSKSVVEGNVCVCLPSTSTNSSRVEESSNRTMYSSANSTPLTKTVLVSEANRVTSGFSKEITTSSRHVDSKKKPSYSCKSRVAKSCRMEDLEHRKSKTKFSSKAQEYIKQAKRSSTRKLYGARLAIYRSWCDRHGVTPDSASVEQIANFFIYLHETRGCKATTISGYRAAIATVHKGWKGGSLSTNTNLSDLIKGIFNASPSVKPLLPNWDLPSVLLSLCESPFEPLETCDLKFLTWKTVFLIATATASRVSELHALSVNSDNLRFESRGVRLIPNLQFLAKSQRIGKVWKPIFIPKFEEFATDPTDLLLCPCRALREYIRRTKEHRSGCDNLFMTYRPGNHTAAAKSTLSRWIVSLIKYVYDNLPDLRLGSVRAHDTRRLSTSWALFNGAPLSEILQAAHWARETTFTSFYLKDVCTEDNFARASLLKTVVWAKNRKKD